jgi:predicted transcriptional regulator
MTIKMSVNLSDDAAKTLKSMADTNGVTVTEELRRSISTELWREQVEKAGAKVLVEYPDGQVREVLFQR